MYVWQWLSARKKCASLRWTTTPELMKWRDSAVDARSGTCPATITLQGVSWASMKKGWFVVYKEVVWFVPMIWVRNINIWYPRGCWTFWVSGCNCLLFGSRGIMCGWTSKPDGNSMSPLERWLNCVTPDRSRLWMMKAMYVPKVVLTLLQLYRPG